MLHVCADPVDDAAQISAENRGERQGKILLPRSRAYFPVNGFRILNGPRTTSLSWCESLEPRFRPIYFSGSAAQEVEEDRDHGKVTVAERRGSTNKELRIAKRDVITGMLLSNLVMYFLILTSRRRFWSSSPCC